VTAAFEPFEHPDLAHVGAAMRDEWRAEEEAATRDAVELWRHNLTLASWLRDRMHAGDRVSVSFHDRTFTGVIVEVGADVCALRGEFGRVDVQLVDDAPFEIRVVHHPSTGGRRGTTPARFRETLIAREQAVEVTLGTRQRPDGITGRMSVGRDFVTVTDEDGIDVLVPIRSVLWVALADG
jgi:hypothetical protein